jgi:predicted Fe-Mo cluster-binding NifX family protein
MKIAISSDGKTVESQIDQRFGRCKYFVIINTEKPNEIKTIENEGAIQGHGAGIRASEQMGELGVEVVLTGNLGPNATTVLEKLEIKTYHSSGIIKDAIDDFVNNKLEKINEISEPHPKTSKKETTKGEVIFFPLLENNGENSKISQHFGHAPFFGIYDVNNKQLKITENNLDHTDPTKSPIDQIQEATNPTTIFAKGIGGRAIGIIAEKGLALKTGDYSTIKEVIENLEDLKDQIQSCGH